MTGSMSASAGTIKGMTDAEELSTRVKAARLQRGWSKEAAARYAGISSITWKRVEDALPVQDVKRQAVIDILDLADEEGVDRRASAADERPTGDALAVIDELAVLVRELVQENRHLRAELERRPAAGQ